MDRRERVYDPTETLRAALEGMQTGLWTALPGIVQSADLGKLTAVIQPAIKVSVGQPDGSRITVALPLLLDCPIVFPQGGGFTLTFPVQAGDECLVVFASRCIDAWWQNGGIQEQAELRLHDLSDGFALMGVRSQVRLLTGVSTASTQLRTDAGDTFVEVKSGEVTVTAPTKVTVNTDQAVVNSTTSVEIHSPLSTFLGNVVIQGSLTVQGLLSFLAGLLGVGGMAGSTISGDITHTSGNLSSNGKILHTHTHPQSGGGNTGAPN